MREISHADAFREFTKWSKNSLVGFNFGRRDAAVTFFMRQATLEVQESALLIEVEGRSMSTLQFSNDVRFFELTAEDVKLEFVRLYPIKPSFNNCIGAKFGNEDFCLLFVDGERLRVKWANLYGC
jgi:hypothetical protein